ncbi:3-phenylpropionate/trans-cinnamate dioxygenase ferredoxin reductase subunit [Sphingobium xenophagum]|uniref:3-phenylpropionate/trans-cinnamate dioxygenase ferredoxin reductase subunit n=1 Tax=Sphingobium xenophagum TaxID=121428 RepID=A0ABU1X2D8_SPHXE|nr:FAD-dependent oxidoreductase [Sphingobium xenophagum]MDR7155726.1 3-phenylpropionate/trans-cinnamate dioxygenase ferredoxin reductase subunit [Sphingobium xenophagum]
MAETFALIGGGYATSRAADCLRQEGFQGRIVLISEEQHLPYSRPPLCKKGLLVDMPVKRLVLRHQNFYDDNNIELRLGASVTGIDRRNRIVTIESSEPLQYDKLLIGTGGRPRTLPIQGSDLAGIHVIRTVEDARGLKAALAPGVRLVIIGAGYIGMETAAAARMAGMDVTVIELTGRLMSRVVAPVTSEFFARYHLDHGVKLMPHRSAMAFEGAGRVEAVLLDDGQLVATDVVLVAAGNIPEYRLAADAGLECEGGIVVDDRCRTSDPNIFAAGDCTRHPSVRYGRRIQLESVDNALEQARVAAAGMCGRRVRHAHVPWFWSDQYDLKLQIVGLSDGFDEVIVRGDADKPGFTVWYLKDKEVISMEAVNSPIDFVQAGRWIGGGAKVDAQILADADRHLDEAVLVPAAPPDPLASSTDAMVEASYDRHLAGREA